MPTRHRLLPVCASAAAVLAALAMPARAQARPPDFPDLSRYATVADTTPYERSWRGGWELDFTTPDRSLSCNFDVTASCSGRIAAAPGPAPAPHPGNDAEGCPYVSYAGTVTSDDKPYTINPSGGSCPPFVGTTLGPNQKLSTRNMTCGVGDESVVACIDSEGKHGFVLRQTGSTAF